MTTPRTQQPGAEHPAQPGARQPSQQTLALLRVLPLALLLGLAMLGLRGAIGDPRWNGPQKAHGEIIGILLGALLVVLLAITARRRQAATTATGTTETAVKLRTVLIYLLAAGIVADVAAIFYGLHLKLFRAAKPVVRSSGKLPPQRPPGQLHGSHVTHSSPIPLEVVVYVLVIAAVVTVLAAVTMWAKRLSPKAQLGVDEPDDEQDEEDLRQAVAEGRKALREAPDDARVAIVACYAAMEDHLAGRGAARAAADTPDELLARAITAGLVRGPAARSLTRLFYEARFSTHPMSDSQRHAAEQALDELAATLSTPEPAP